MVSAIDNIVMYYAKYDIRNTTYEMICLLPSVFRHLSSQYDIRNTTYEMICLLFSVFCFLIRTLLRIRGLPSGHRPYGFRHPVILPR